MSCTASKADLEKLLTRLDEIENTVNGQTAAVMAKEVGIETEQNKEKKSLDESIQEPVASTAPEDTPPASALVAEPEIEKSDEPKREDFECPIEFHKAYTKWVNDKEASTPVTKSDLEKFMTDLKAELLKAIPDMKIEGDLTLGEAVKKSIPIPRSAPTDQVDFTKWLKSATEVSPSAVVMEAK